MFQHFLKRSVRPLFYVPPKPVGRWNIHKQNDSLYLNNYYSNIDHCGGCNYQKETVQKIINDSKNIKDKIDNN